MTELQDNTLVEISEMDLATILSETFCGNYTPFKGLRVHSVDQNEGTDMFTIRMSPIEPDKGAA